MTKEDLERLFNYHAPSPEQVEGMQIIRSIAKKLTEKVDKFLPDGPDKDFIIHNIRTAVMFTNQGIVLSSNKREI